MLAPDFTTYREASRESGVVRPYVFSVEVVGLNKAYLDLGWSVLPRVRRCAAFPPPQALAQD